MALGSGGKRRLRQHWAVAKTAQAAAMAAPGTCGRAVVMAMAISC